LMMVVIRQSAQMLPFRAGRGPLGRHTSSAIICVLV
jgi:hypothetical protein